MSSSHQRQCRPTETDRAVPSQLYLLSDLKHAPVETKVRFLGCIEEFVLGSSTALLSHKLSTKARASLVTVDLENVLGTLPNSVLETGSWINVIGYVTSRPGPPVGTAGEKTNGRWVGKAHVQALMAWSAGSIDVSVYESAVKDRTAGSRIPSTANS